MRYYPIPFILSLLLLGNLGCQVTEEASVSTESASGSLFQLLPPESSGITFRNEVPEDEKINILTFEYFHNGGGVAIGDVNNDDRPDIYLTGNVVPNHLYLNQGGMKFKEVAQQANVKGAAGWNTGVTMVDINNDGWLDIYVCRGGQLPPEYRSNQLFINQGADPNGIPQFKEEAGRLGLSDEGFTTQAAFLDYDRDGDLDVFLLNHNVVPIENFNPVQVRSTPDPYVGDKLYENVGSATAPKFVDVSQRAGLVQHPLGYGLGVGIGDLNNDGWPDIYVSNDFLEHDYLYYNQGDGTFTEELKGRMPHVSQFSMGNDIADYNNDGWLDIFVADMVAEDNYRNKTMMRGMDRSRFHYAVEDGFHYQYMINTLQLNNGVLRTASQETVLPFSEAAQLGGVSNTDWSWAPLWLDLDNDGFKDLIVTNGYKKEVSNKDYVSYEKKKLAAVSQPDQADLQRLMQELLDSIPSTKIPNYVYHNNGDLTFTKKVAEWGFDRPAFSNGAAFGDLDNDGDLDVVINNIDDNAFLYENQAGSSANYLKIKLNGSEGNRDGIGTRITIYANQQQQMHEHYLSRGFQSSVDRIVHFGLGTTEKIDSLLIRWADGKTQTLRDISANQLLSLNYQDASNPNPTEKPSDYLFQDITEQAQLRVSHQENDFDDFEREVLLPHKMSNFGPALAIADVNGDGLDDFYLGGAKGLSGQLYQQTANGTFRLLSSKTFRPHQASEDLDALFFDADQDGDPDLYVVSGGNEYTTDSPQLQDRLYFNDGNGGFSHRTSSLPKMLSSGGKVASADIDLDGDLDLFVGGRQVPGRYPLAPRSYLLENNGQGQFTDITDPAAEVLTAIGMVTDARWTDVDQDQDPDLIVTGEWMGIHLILNEQDQSQISFRDVSQEAGLSDTQGWWFSLGAADFDADGDTDLVAGNLGLNYKYQASVAHPFEIFYSDFDESGTYDIVLGYHNNDSLFPLRGRQCSSEQMPFIAQKFPDYHSFGQATLAEVYGSENLSEALHYEAKTFASSYLKNNGVSANGIPQFEVIPLPNEAQLSSANAITISDFNQDNHLDIVIGGNLYASEVETPRNDASIGLLLAGDSQGNFNPVPAHKSGLHLPGDVKKISSLTLGEQNRAGLLVAKNQGLLQLVRTQL